MVQPKELPERHGYVECAVPHCKSPATPEVGGMFCIDHWKICPEDARAFLNDRHVEDERPTKEWLEIARKAVMHVYSKDLNLTPAKKIKK